MIVLVHVTVTNGDGRTLGRSVARLEIPEAELSRGVEDPSDLFVDGAGMAVAEAYNNAFGHRASGPRLAPCGCKSSCLHRKSPQLEHQRECKLEG